MAMATEPRSMPAGKIPAPPFDTVDRLRDIAGYLAVLDLSIAGIESESPLGDHDSSGLRRTIEHARAALDPLLQWGSALTAESIRAAERICSAEPATDDDEVDDQAPAALEVVS